MRTVAVIAFLAGLLLAVRVMFFGVRKQLDEERLTHRRWPLAIAAFLFVAGFVLYLQSNPASALTAQGMGLVLLAGVLAATGAWWIVTRSAAVPSSDPEDDPRYRYQGHVARVVEAIGNPGEGDGRITFEFDGNTIDFRARWSSSDEWTPSPTEGAASGQPGAEVVIEVVQGDVAFVEPWRVVEERL